MTAVPVPSGGCASGGAGRRPAPGLELDFHLPERAMEIAFSAPAGQTTALVGHNGAGKTSTFEVVAGILRPARARVRLGDRILQDSGTEGIPADRATASRGEVWTPPHERGVVQVVQRPLLFPTMSVLENAAFGLRASGTPAREARRAARDMLERLDAGDLADRRPRELSGGQAQRVAIARALVTSPELLLLDEPFAALDEGSATLVRELLADQLEGKSALLISHDADTVRALASHLVVLSHGRVVYSGLRSCEDAESFLPNRPRDR